MKLTYVENEIVIAVHEYIAINFLESFPIGSLCKTYEIGESKLTKGFKTKYEITIYGYYLQKRMNYAMELLKSGKDVGTVATVLEYSTPGSFSRAFKKIYPKPPNSYRYVKD